MSNELCTKSDTVVMPRKLTDEDGAKAALSGEFFEDFIIPCSDCLGSGTRSSFPSDDNICPACHGSGDESYEVPVSWETIKAIYDRAVETLSKEHN